MEACGPVPMAKVCGDGRMDNRNGSRFPTASSNNQIRALQEDSDGTLWIGTFGGGLNGLRNGRFFHFTTQDGLLSDNISHVEDDGRGSLWLSTTRGICRVRKQELNDFTAGTIHSIQAVNYGVADGLRSAQCAPGYPTSRGGTQEHGWTPVVSNQPGASRTGSEGETAQRDRARGPSAGGGGGRPSHSIHGTGRFYLPAAGACNSGTPG